MVETQTRNTDGQRHLLPANVGTIPNVVPPWTVNLGEVGSAAKISRSFYGISAKSAVVPISELDAETVTFALGLVCIRLLPAGVRAYTVLEHVQSPDHADTCP